MEINRSGPKSIGQLKHAKISTGMKSESRKPLSKAYKKS